MKREESVYYIIFFTFQELFFFTILVTKTYNFKVEDWKIDTTSATLSCSTCKLESSFSHNCWENDPYSIYP